MEPAPIFVKIEQHKELTKLLATAQQKLKEAETMLEQLERLKAEEDAQLKAWGAMLADVKARTTDLNEALYTNM